MSRAHVTFLAGVLALVLAGLANDFKLGHTGAALVLAAILLVLASVMMAWND